MANIFIRSVVVCDTDRNPFSRDETFDAYRVPFSPKNGPGISRNNYLAVTCDVSPSNSLVQAKFFLRELNLADFALVAGAGQDQLVYLRNVRNGDTVFLPFQSRSKKAVQNCLLSGLRLIVKDSAPNSTQTSQQTTRVKAV